MNLVMNSLEEAFINIGLDEQRFLNKIKGDNIFSEQDNYFNLKREPMPEFMKHKQNYSFI